jgi:hypothetical protein
VKLVGLLFEEDSTIDSRRYVRGEFAEIEEHRARTLVRSGAASYADGRPAEEGDELRAFNIPSRKTINPRGTTRVV